MLPIFPQNCSSLFTPSHIIFLSSLTPKADGLWQLRSVNNTSQLLNFLPHTVSLLQYGICPKGHSPSCTFHVPYIIWFSPSFFFLEGKKKIIRDFYYWTNFLFFLKQYVDGLLAALCNT